MAFANLYRKALLAHHEGNRAAHPKAWQLSLDTSAAGMGLVIQDLLTSTMIYRLRCKYSRLVAFEDILAGRLDEMISDIIYTRARREAWSDGLALHSEPLKDQREKLITLIDCKAVRAANKALFWDLPPVRLMCQAARKLEDAFAGNWSERVEED